jgi:hypothetical protein
MPAEPPGEADLRALSERFAQAEARIRALLARAPNGDRRALLIEALGLLVALGREDARGPVATAYLVAFREVAGLALARRAVVEDLAGPLALKLERGAQRASAGARDAFRTVTEETVDERALDAVTAHVGKDGTRWPLGAWAVMNTETIGRQATTRGLVDAVGNGGKLIVDVGECGYCQDFAGEAVVGEDPLPPFHPSCTCTASAA